jgi:hypothetical protein
MGRFEIPDHPEIAWMERTGYPSWMQEDNEEGDEDRFYEEARDADFDCWED